MGNLKRFAKPTATFSHPNIETLKFTSEKPRPEEALEFADKRSLYQRRVPAINPETKDPIYSKDGELQFIDLPSPVPFSMITDYLKKHIKNVEGMKDEDGPVPYLGNEDAIFSELLKKEYHVIGKNAEGKETRQQCVFWLTYEIHEEERYRPLGVTGSQKPSTGATAEPEPGA